MAIRIGAVRYWCLRVLALGVAFAPVLPARAHPHVFVTARTIVMFDAEGRIAAFRHAWTFDDAFSTYATAGLDKDKDGKFSREELADLAKVNVESLQEFGYFTAYRTGRSNAEFDAPKDYYLDHDGKALTLHYTLPLKTAMRPTSRDRVEIDDPTYYVAFDLGASAVTLEGDARGCTLKTEGPKPAAQGRLSQLSESFFNSLSASSGLSDVAYKIRFTCP